MICNGKLAGVVSFGPNEACGLAHLPGVYTKISLFAKVIDKLYQKKIEPQVWL